MQLQMYVRVVSHCPKKSTLLEKKILYSFGTAPLKFVFKKPLAFEANSIRRRFTKLHFFFAISTQNFVFCLYHFLAIITEYFFDLLQINEFEKVTIRCVLFQESPDVLLTAGEIPPYGWEKRFYNR